MLPIRDNIPSARFPLMTLAIIVVNVLVFLWEARLGARLERALLGMAIIPARYSVPEVAQQFNPVEQVFPFFSSMFLHGGWIHLIGNMWTLWIFGDNVEDRLGRSKFIALYLASGIAAAFLHIFTNLHSVMPTIGASGAVAGVMGAYFRFYPHAKIETIIPPFIFGPYYVLPAVLFLGWWFLLQFFSGALSLADKRDFGGIAWWAHVGGFAFGVAVCVFAGGKRRR
ncbi:MAG: rhomboid family intramembrane serine protease [Verrucomicrobiota bacterium]